MSPNEGPSADTPSSQEWYTVPEAAEFLGVSQPTIFRWMKQGLLSFYKVGGATRFTREGLLAVVEKSTGQKEAEASRSRCASCGHGVLVPGRLQGTGRIYFHPEKTRFWTLSESLVPIAVKVCPSCGYVQMFVDSRKLRPLLRDADRASLPEEGEAEA